MEGVDPAGQVFLLDSAVYRAISQPYVSLYRQLVEGKYIAGLFKAVLVETWVSDIELDGYGLGVSHISEIAVYKRPSSRKPLLSGK